jgi:nitrous oxide reductase
MKERRVMAVHRRQLLRLAIVSTAAATTGTLAVKGATAEPIGGANKRKSRYQANSAEVQDFYRVNSYPAK